MTISLKFAEKKIWTERIPRGSAGYVTLQMEQRSRFFISSRTDRVREKSYLLSRPAMVSENISEVPEDIFTARGVNT